MNIEDLTIKQLREASRMLNNTEQAVNEVPFEIGENYFIRTVTYFHTGKVKCITGNFLVLESAAWIADTGRFSDALKNTTFKEVEPFTNDVIVNLEAIIDATIIDGELPVGIL